MLPSQLGACESFRIFSQTFSVLPICCIPRRDEKQEEGWSHDYCYHKMWICFCITLEKSNSACLYLVMQHPAEILELLLNQLPLKHATFQSFYLHLSLCCFIVQCRSSNFLRVCSCTSALACDSKLCVVFLSFTSPNLHWEKECFEVVCNDCVHAWP